MKLLCNLCQLVDCPLEIKPATDYTPSISSSYDHAIIHVLRGPLRVASWLAAYLMVCIRWLRLIQRDQAQVKSQFRIDSRKPTVLVVDTLPGNINWSFRLL